jgi:hypothetical protein
MVIKIPAPGFYEIPSERRNVLIINQLLRHHDGVDIASLTKGGIL